MSNVEQFKGSFSEMARPNRFGVSGFGLGGQLQFLAKGASLPSATLSPAEAWYAGRSVKLAGDRQYPDWTVTMYQDIDAILYQNFQLWQQETLDHVSNLGWNSWADYKRDGQVVQYDREGFAIVGFTLIGAIPTELGALDLASDSNDTPSEFPVTLAFDYFIPMTVGDLARFTTDTAGNIPTVLSI